MPIYTIRNERLIVDLHQDDNTLSCQVRHTDGGYTSPTVPLVAMEVCDRMQERVDRLTEYRVMQIEHDEKTIHVTVRDRSRGVTIGIWLTLTDGGELDVLVPPAEVEEATERLYRVYAVDVLPGLLEAGPDGVLLLPVNSGVLCRPAGKPKTADRFLIYGEQERWELVPTLPITAVQTPTGGLTALASEGATDMYCGVSADGQGRACANLYPMFRRQWVDPVDWTHRAVRIGVLAANDDVVVAAAKRVRRHVIDDLGKPTLAERAAESPQCAYQQRAYTMKIFHGIQQQGIMMYGRESEVDQLLYKRTLTFADAQRCFKRLKDAGLDRIYFQSVGWNPRGHDGAWPTDGPVDRRLGGERGFVDMIDTAKSLGYHITTHLNLASSFFSSPDFKRDWVMTDIWGEPKVVGFWGGGVKSTHWGLAVPEEHMRGRLERLKAYGFNGMQYLDGIGNPLYINYHPTNGGPRRDHAAGINLYLDLARDVFGAVQTEMGFLYCSLHADAMCSPGGQWHLDICKDEWPITCLLDERVPGWHLALHDLVTCEAQGVSWEDTMRAMLLAGVPRDEWTVEPGVFGTLDDRRIAQLKARYDLCCERFGHLISQEMTGWQRLAEKVEQTTFADGTQVTADFEQGRLTVDGEEITCPNVLSNQT